MKKSLIFIYIFILIFLLSFVSAFSFSGFWNRITGKATLTCTDSDGGQNFEVFGTTNDPFGASKDKCLFDGKTLIEYYCSGILRKSVKHVCSDVCENRICTSSTKTCSDGTLINQCSTTKPKYCIKSLLSSDPFLIDNCETCGCPENQVCQSDGTCKTSQPQTCIDSDSGKNYFVKGTCTDFSGSHEDSCDSLGKVEEWYCSEFSNECSSVKSNCDLLSSGYVCGNGVCILSDECNDSCSSLGYECGNWTICGEEINCGSCEDEEICNMGVCKIEESKEKKGCREEGEKVNRNPFLGSTDEECCEGLMEIRVSKSYSICVNCGDGVCKSPEDESNCVQDCGEFNDTRCSDGTLIHQCSTTKPKYCENGTLINNCAECGCQGNQICQENGNCEMKSINKKLMSRYSDKEVFLISDEDWKDVLPLVPVTTWTQQEGNDSECQRGYGTPDNVCVYPTLIHHHDSLKYAIHDRFLNTGEVYREKYETDGNIVVFRDSKEGISFYDLLTEEIEQIPFSVASSDWKLSNGKLVGYDRHDFYLYDFLVGVERKLFLTEIQNINGLAFSGENFVFGEIVGQVTIDNKDYFVRDISLYNLVTGIKTKIAEDVLLWIGARDAMTISNDYVIWSEFLEEKDYLNVYEIFSGVITRIELESPPVHLFAYGEKIVWEALMGDNYEIFMYDLSTNKKIQITMTSLDEFKPQILEEGIVYERIEYQMTGDIYFYDLQTKQETAIAENLIFYEDDPRCADNTILFCRDNCEKGIQIYDSNVNEEYEVSSFDIDSIIYFMQQYAPNKLTIIGETPQELDNLLLAEPELGAGLSEEQIQRRDINDYLSYWETFNNIVYVEDDYELALLASTYASLINAPLIIQGSSLDNENVFSEKDVICVGDVMPFGNNCEGQYDLESLRAKYLEETNTNKVILVNPDDLDIKVEEEFFSDKSTEPIYNLYTKTSLSAPVLASAKHELILSTTETNYKKIDDFIEEQFNELFEISLLSKPFCSRIGTRSEGWSDNEGFIIKYDNCMGCKAVCLYEGTENEGWYSFCEGKLIKLGKCSLNSDFYLTIVGAPNAIPYRERMDDIGRWENYRALDQTEYADMNNDMIPDISVGRIQGISSSDVSSYVARDLFYETLERTNNVKFMASSFDYMINQANGWVTAFKQVGYNAISVTNESNCYSFDPVEWENQDLISYADHGGGNWAGISSSSIPLLNNPLVSNDACSTCDSYNKESFCNNAIRQGALVHLGAVCIAWTSNTIYMNTMNGIYYNNLTAGQAFTTSYVNNKFRYMTTFFGDPTLKLKPLYLLNEPLEYWV